MVENPQATFQAEYKSPHMSQTGLRPYSSVNGARIIGPTANARMKMDNDSSDSDSVIRRSWEMFGRAGAIILPDIIVTKPPREINTVTAHL